MKTREEVNAWNARVVAECRERQAQLASQLDELRRAQEELCARIARERRSYETWLLHERDAAARREQARQDKLDAIEARRLARLGMT